MLEGPLGTISRWGRGPRLRSGGEVPDAGPTVAERAVAGGDGVPPAPRPRIVDAARPGRRGGGRQHGSWDFRDVLIRAEALDEAFAELDRAIAAGCLPGGGQIVDGEPSSRHRSERRWRGLVAAPRQRVTDGERARIKDGRSAGETEQPAVARRKCGPWAAIDPAHGERGALNAAALEGRGAGRCGRGAGRPRGTFVRHRVARPDRPRAWADPPPARHGRGPPRRRPPARGT